METIIREWKYSDYVGIANLFLQVHQLHQNNRPDIYSETNTPFSQTAFNEVCENKNSIALVAELGTQIIGFTIVTLKEPSANPLLLPRKVAYMEDLAVHEDYRSQGVGTMLFNSVKNEACRLGYNKLELMVWEFNEVAIHFYTKLGMNNRSIIMEMSI